MIYFLLVLGVFVLLCALACAWESGKKSSVGLAVGATVLAGLGVLVLLTWQWSLGEITSEPPFDETNNGKNIVYVFIGDTVSTLNGEKTHITTLYIPGDREYVYRFKNLPPKGYTSLKTETGQELYVPEKYILLSK